MVLTQQSSMKHSLCNWGISVPQFNFSTTLCSIQSLLRCYILIYMIYRPIQNLNSKIHNAKTQHTAPSHHISNTPSHLCTATQDILPSSMTAQLSACLLGSAVTISHFHFISWCHSGYSHFCRMPSPKRWKKPAFVPGFQGSEFLISLFLSSQKR